MVLFVFAGAHTSMMNVHTTSEQYYTEYACVFVVVNEDQLEKRKTENEWVNEWVVFSIAHQ